MFISGSFPVRAFKSPQLIHLVCATVIVHLFITSISVQTLQVAVLRITMNFIQIFDSGYVTFILSNKVVFVL